jgi:hypothetical protein
LKKCLTNLPVLAYPEFTRPFILYADASRIGLDAVLTQIQDDRERLILCLSRTTLAYERNYDATESEMLAGYWAIRKLRMYLQGTEFTLVTDHSALRQILTLRTDNQGLQKWRVELAAYADHMKIVHQAGKN